MLSGCANVHGGMLCGVNVDDFTRIGARHKEPALTWLVETESHGKLSSGPFNEMLRVESDQARVLAAFGQDAGYYAGKPALVENIWGRGRACYLGGVFTTSTARALALHLGLNPAASDLVALPPDVEIAIRERSSGERLVFLLNYAEAARTIEVHARTVDLLTGNPVSGELTLGAFGVAVLKG